MNTEQKAKAYDRAKDIMEKYLKSGNAGVIAENTIKNAFPELHENEDEIVKEELINYLKHRCNTTTLSGEERACNKWIAWLEKQGEQTDKIVERAKTEKQRVLITESDGEANIDWDTRSLQDVKLLLEYGLDYIKKLDEKNCLSNTKHSMGDLKIISSLKNIIHTYWNNLPDSALEENEVAESCYRWLEKQGQKPADNFKPKFKISNWIINRTGATIMQIVNNEDFYESVEIGGQRRTDTYNYVERDFRLWSIEDAKDGDVLVHNGFTFIFKGIEDGIVKGLCSELSDSILNFGEPEHDKDYYPATKEQRYFLFQKMKEAGYEWDVEKKELKKIENRPMLSDFFNAEYERGKADALKSVEWSEEDEKNLVQCIEAIDVYYEWDSMIDWLKSLRSRSRWKPSEEQMRALHDMNLTGNISYAGQGQVLIELYNDLKKL